MDCDSISVIRLRNTLLVTIPPDPDDELIQALQEKVLAVMEKNRAEGVIFDISTVDILDSFFARTIIDTVQMIALMGGRTVIAGMLPNVAITATELGLTFESIDTALDVDTALDILQGERRP